MSPGVSSAWCTILLAVDVPLVTKKLRSPPSARAALSWATLMLPVGSSRLSRPPVVARRLGEKQVGAVELAHVANPVRLEDRLSACDRQRVIRADWPLGVFLQDVEVGRLVPVVDAVEDGEMHFQQLFNPIEHAPDACGFIGAGKLPDVAIGQQIDVQLGPDPVHHPLERRAEVGLRLEGRRATCTVRECRAAPGRRWTTARRSRRR